MLAIDMTSYRSPNFDRHTDGRPVVHTPIGIVLHSGGGTKASDLGWLCSAASGVSSHYYIDRDGHIYQLVPDEYRAWHAGRSFYGGITDWNKAIGIELEHTKGVHTDYPLSQRSALRALCLDLIAHHHILAAFIQSHRAIAVPRGRKSDPLDWPERELRAWVTDLLPTPMARLWAVSAEIGANIRQEPSAITTKLGALARGATFHGAPVSGQPVEGNATWVARLSSEGGGYVWSGALREVK